MRPYILSLVAVILMLATGASSFAGEVDGMQANCQSTCTTCEGHMATPTPMKGYGPKGGPTNKQVVSQYLSNRSDAYPGTKVAPQCQATVEAAPAATAAVSPCEVCKMATRESMRGPKGGYLVHKGTTYYEIEHKITEACRLACAK